MAYASKSEVHFDYVPAGQITMKSIYIENINQYKLVYILGALEKEKLSYVGISKEDFEKVVFT